MRLASTKSLGIQLGVLGVVVLIWYSTKTPAEKDARQSQNWSAVTASTDGSDDDFNRRVNAFFTAFPESPYEGIGLDSASADWVEATLENLSLRERAGQLLIVRHGSRSAGEVVNPRVVRAIAVHNVGGFLMSRLLPPDELIFESNRMQSIAGVPLFIAADFERGVGRFNNTFTELPSNMGIGATRNAVYAAAAGRLTAIEARAAGVNLVLAPVVDVNNNPHNPIINIRAYSEDAATVARMASAFVGQAESHGVLTSVKHFPGHGNVSIDTHSDLAVVAATAAELDSVELYPYRMLLQDSIPPSSIMTAHVWSPAFDADVTPASFSRNIVAEYLRGRLGFEGVVITDDIRMGALANRYDLAARVVNPLLAGADVLLTPEDIPGAIDAIVNAVESGRITEARLNDSVRRVLLAKASAGLHRDRYAALDYFETLSSEDRGAQLAAAAAADAVTLVRSGNNVALKDDATLAVVQLSNFLGSESIAAGMQAFVDALGTDNLREDLRLDRPPTSDEIVSSMTTAGGADVVVIALHLRLQSGRGEAGMIEGHEALVRRLVDVAPRAILVVFGNPYVVTQIGDIENALDAVVIAYDQTVATTRAAADVLRGRMSPAGRLPVTVGRYALGFGLDVSGNRLETADRH